MQYIYTYISSVHVWCACSHGLTSLALLAVLLLSPGDSRYSQEGVLGVTVPHQKLLVWRNGLKGESEVNTGSLRASFQFNCKELL